MDAMEPMEGKEHPVLLAHQVSGQKIFFVHFDLNSWQNYNLIGEHIYLLSLIRTKSLASVYQILQIIVTS